MLRDWIALTILVPSLVEVVTSQEYDQSSCQYYKMMSGGPVSQYAGGWLWWNIQKSAAGERKVLGAGLVLELVTL
jgi:hypothetical protein